MSATMKAFYLHGARDLRPAQVEVPELEPDQVLVKVKACGLCGTDLHYYAHGRNGDFVPRRPFILGHEFAGEIADAGLHEDILPVGSRVAIDPSNTCRVCRYCLEGRYNLCKKTIYFGSAATDPHIDGSFREYIPVLAHRCHLIPAALPFREAALLEPLSVALHGIGQAGNIAGKRVLICGAGPIGQLLGLVARHYGAERLAVSDLRPLALDLAGALWADTTIRADRPAQVEEAWRAFDGFDAVIEASGAATALQTAVERCRPGGVIVQVGIQEKEVDLPINLVMQRELTIRGSFRFTHVFARALDLVGQRKLNLQPLITGEDEFPNLSAGFEKALGAESIKTVINY